MMKPMSDQLANIRRKIEETDRQLFALLAERLELVRQVGENKRVHGLPVRVPEREAALIAAAIETSGLPPAFVREFYQLLFNYAYAIENDSKEQD